MKELFPEQLMNIHRKALYMLLSKNVMYEDAEDIVQEAIGRYLKKPGNIGNVEAYIITICNNLLSKYYKRNNQHEEYIDNIDILNTNYYENLTYGHREVRSNAIVVQDALKILPKEYHDLFTLYYKAGCNIKELAKNLGKNYNSFKSRIFTMKTYLRAYYLIQKGVVISKHLLNRMQKENFRNFIGRFKKACLAGECSCMYGYFSKEAIAKINLDFDIKRIRYYDFSLRSSRTQYDANVFYEESSYSTIQDLKFFFCTFYLDGNRIKIVRPPRKPKCLKHLSDNAKTKVKSITSINRENKKTYFTDDESKLIIDCIESRNAKDDK